MHMCFELAIPLVVIYLFILRKSSQMCAEIYLPMFIVSIIYNVKNWRKT